MLRVLLGDASHRLCHFGLGDTKGSQQSRTCGRRCPGAFGRPSCVRSPASVAKCSVAVGLSRNATSEMSTFGLRVFITLVAVVAFRDRLSGVAGNSISPSAENDLQVGVTVEGAGQDPCEGGETGLGVPSPAAGAQDHRRPPVEPAVGDVAQLL